jgi:hypothetical protein
MMLIRSPFAALVLLLHVFGAGAAQAHDFWIAPDSYRPSVGALLRARLRVGDGFVGEAYPRNPKHLRRFALVDASGERGLWGRTGSDPAGSVSIARAGGQAVVYRSARSATRLSARRFAAHLREHGLRSIVQLRARRGDANMPAREVFSRCAKALLLAGPKGGDGDDFHAQALGLDLELVPDKSPYRLAPGEPLSIRLLYRGQPVRGARVAARSARTPRRAVVARTDAQGRARLALRRRGPWLVTAVHMFEAPRGLGADWESLWASLTFER